MRWNDRRRSNNVEDRRGQPSSASGGGNLPLGLIALLLRTKTWLCDHYYFGDRKLYGFDFNSLLQGKHHNQHKITKNNPPFIMKRQILAVLVSQYGRFLARDVCQSRRTIS